MTKTTSQDKQNNSNDTIRSYFARYYFYFLRVVVVVCLLGAGAGCGYVFHQLVNDLENEVAESTYKSIAQHALSNAKTLTQSKLDAGKALATLVSFHLPDSSAWPFIGLYGFPEISDTINDLSENRFMNLVVLVDPSDAKAFENHAQEYYGMHNPEGAGYSEFGFGIFAVNHSISNYSDGRYNDITGRTSFSSSYDILAVIFLHTFPASSALMYNIHSEEFRARGVDSMISCFNSAVSRSKPVACSVVTDFVTLLTISDAGPSALLYQPVYSPDNATTLVGLITTSIVWTSVLDSLFPDKVRDLDCVISTDTAAYTWTVGGGKSVLKGAGDLHNKKFSSLGKSIVLNNDLTDASASVLYTLTLYPTEALFEEFRTNTSQYVGFGSSAVAVILLIGVLLFYMYEYKTRKEFREAKQVLDSKRRFVRFISHEIRTPLNTVVLGMTLMQSELKKRRNSCKLENDDDKVEDFNSKRQRICMVESDLDEWLQISTDVLDNAQNAVSVLNDVLSYDKVETGTLRLDITDVNVWSLVNRAVKEFAIQARQSSITMHLIMEQRVEYTRLKVVGDHVRLAQVVRNLISNALKFTPADGSIVVSCEWIAGNDARTSVFPMVLSPGSVVPGQICPSSGVVRIQVQDNGAGMKECQIKKLFDEGVQFDVNTLQAGQGSGLGLYISQGIVNQHGGIMYATSEGVGKGATFTVELPLSDTFEQEVSQSIQGSDTDNNLHAVTESLFCDLGSVSVNTNQPRPSVTESSGYRILVVDDAPTNRKMLIRILTKQGYVCDYAESGREAVDKYSACNSDNYYHTILMDYEMPSMNGPEAAMELRAMGCKSLIIGITGNILPDDVTYFKSCGVFDVLPKPLNIASLERVWNEYEEYTQCT